MDGRSDGIAAPPEETRCKDEISKSANIGLGQKVLDQRRHTTEERDTLCLYQSQRLLSIPFGNHDNPLRGHQGQDKRPQQSCGVEQRYVQQGFLLRRTTANSRNPPSTVIVNMPVNIMLNTACDSAC